MFITPIAAMIFTVVLLIVACLTIHFTYDKNRLGFFRSVVVIIYFTIMIMFLLNLGLNPDIKFSLATMSLAMLLAQVVIVPISGGFWDYSKPVNSIMLLMVTETGACIILQYVALLCS